MDSASIVTFVVPATAALPTGVVVAAVTVWVLAAEVLLVAVVMPVGGSSSRRDGAASVSESGVPAGSVGTAGPSLVGTRCPCADTGWTDAVVATTTALVTPVASGAGRAPTVPACTPVTAACLPGKPERAGVPDRRESEPPIAGYDESIRESLAGVGLGRPVASTPPVPVVRWGSAELDAAALRAPDRRGLGSPVSPGFDESIPESLAGRDLGPVADPADVVTDDSPAEGFEGPASELSACALPAAATAVPIPKATAKAPMRPISKAQEGTAAFARFEARVRKAFDGNSSADIPDPPIS